VSRVSYETIRRWCAKLGQAYASGLRRRRPRPGDKWHCDEVFIRINATQHYLWRAVDQHGNVLDIMVQSRRNALAAKRFFRKLLKNLEYVPRVIVTDKLGSYQVAHRELLASVEHRRAKHLNNRIENSHQPTGQRERAMKRTVFHSGGSKPNCAASLFNQRDSARIHLVGCPHRTGRADRRGHGIVGIAARTGRLIHDDGDRLDPRSHLACLRGRHPPPRAPTPTSCSST
jgi:putative transposase